jgi:hypothetical protein
MNIDSIVAERKETERTSTETIDLLAALQPILHHLQAQAMVDQTLRNQLRQLGQTLLAWTDKVANESLNKQSPTRQAGAEEKAPAGPSVRSTTFNGYGLNGHPSVREPLRVLRTIDQTPSWRAATVSDADLAMIAERCRLKAEGARWAARRQQLLREGAEYDTEIEPNDREIIARAKMLPECFLWMCHRDGPTPDDLSEYETLACCFEAAADACKLVEGLLEHASEERDLFTDALDLAAEAQSALRIAITDIGGSTDSDQYKLFQWLKQTGSEQQILIRRHMRKDDPADPALARDLRERIHQQEERILNTRGRAKRHRGLFSKIRYHLKLIEQNRGQDRSYDWQKVMDGVEELVDEGLPPSNRELRDLLLPLADEIPDVLELSKNFRIVLRELDGYLSSLTEKAEESPEAATPTEEVQRAAELLRGRTVVLIGGLRRPQAAEALTQALELKELVWVEGRDQTYADFEPYVARPDVAVVILAIRWSRHGFGEVKEFCDKYDKPLVRLPGGYSPNQVAANIMNQVAERLSNKALIPA